ncbi:MAG: amidohydrolase family protein [Woeseiaceae bacterium]|nr:amidohydrolase family protein [Woeseiaceae bacterium]
MTCLLALLFAAGPLHAQEADLVLRNGVVWTVDADNPQVTAIATSGDRILYVGSDAGATKHIGRGTRVIDLDGKLVVPGFNDNHVHFDSTGRLLYGLNLLDVSDEEAFVARIRATCHERTRRARG